MMPISHIKVAAALAKQGHDMLEHPSDGITYVPNPSDIYTIIADISGPVSTPYEGGVFRCHLNIDNDFPTKPPKGYFLTKIFHPNVSPAGEICVNTLKRDWNPSNWSLRNILEVIRCLLIVPFPESSLNEEAGKLFMENYEEYSRTARVFCNIYAKKKTPGLASPGACENYESKGSPEKHPEEVGKKEDVLGFLNLNPSNVAESSEPKGKPVKNTHAPTSAKKKWMKRIQQSKGPLFELHTDQSF